MYYLRLSKINNLLNHIKYWTGHTEVTKEVLWSNFFSFSQNFMLCLSQIFKISLAK